MSKKKNHLKTSYRDKYLKIKSLYPKLADSIEEGQINSKIFDENQNKDLMHIALEVWKIQKKLKKMKENIGDESIKGFEYPIEKLYEILEKNKIKIIDYTGKKYIEGMNGIDIISVEKDQKQKDAIILDSINPLIEVNGQIYLKSKVIVLSF